MENHATFPAWFRRGETGVQVSGGKNEEAHSADSTASSAEAVHMDPAKELNSVETPGSKGGNAEAVAVTELRIGQKVYVLRQAAARHAGIGVIGVRVLEC